MNNFKEAVKEIALKLREDSYRLTAICKENSRNAQSILEVLEYYVNRCELAEGFISLIDLDKQAMSEYQANAFLKWQAEVKRVNENV